MRLDINNKINPIIADVAVGGNYYHDYAGRRSHQHNFICVASINDDGFDH